MISDLDNDDIRILQLLQQDGRLTKKDIAVAIGKTVSPVVERVKRLEEAGFIRNYVAILDKRKVHRDLTAYVHVQLKEHAADMMSSFQDGAVQFDEVMECYHMTGDYDFLLKVELRDMEEYYSFMLDKLALLPNIGTVKSFFVLHEAKRQTAYHLNYASATRRLAQNGGFSIDDYRD